MMPLRMVLLLDVDGSDAGVGVWVLSVNITIPHHEMCVFSVIKNRVKQVCELNETMLQVLPIYNII